MGFPSGDQVVEGPHRWEAKPSKIITPEKPASIVFFFNSSFISRSGKIHSATPGQHSPAARAHRGLIPQSDCKETSQPNIFRSGAQRPWRRARGNCASILGFLLMCGGLCFTGRRIDLVFFVEERRRTEPRCSDE
jgi:hypothetical protein